MRNWLFLLAAGAYLVSAAAMLHYYSDRSEDKRGYVYIEIFQHWCDVTWEIALPAALAGTAALIAGALLGRRRRLESAQRGFEVV